MYRHVVVQLVVTVFDVITFEFISKSVRCLSNSPTRIFLNAVMVP